ncbi:MAG: GNAT family N-acetyltransferase [Candidatus Bathyarchaeota archaeon]|nr:GNAT family N-acetyltransferase [Candidatus Bathyarchaeota archaeon]
MTQSTDETIPIRVEQRTRRYDSERGCYVYDISFKTRVPLTERTLDVAEAFGLGIDGEREHVLFRDFELRLPQGGVVYITGDSGSGKSVLLRALGEDLGGEAVDLDGVAVDEGVSLIDSVAGSFGEAVGLLSRVGLNDAFLFLRKYEELSEGQRYRYRIARMIDSGKRFWLADEFCSTLDRTTAKVVAFNIQKLARRSGATLVVATTHTDLEADLCPSVLIRKGWGEDIEVEHWGHLEASRCTVTEDISIREGSREDYRRLSHLHYRDSGLPVPREIYAMDRSGELVGVIVYSYPPVRAAGRRNAVGYAPKIDELNRDWAIISRVIVHPKYRTIGLGSRIVRETLGMQGCDNVELIAVMARYNPFAERAGMRLVQVSEPHVSVLRVIESMRGLGFNPVLMGSSRYNSGLLDGLDEGQLEAVRLGLLGVGSAYFKRLSRSGRPYVRKGEFGEWLVVQDNGSLGRVLATLSVLGQCKAYLFWGRAAGLG